ncbi:hypothetical protein [Herbiconiux sp. VKM Ac-2851]|uniref:hypothetical protein n=1 Tax=Herbiconiux sp. VKM Ac-2851 TaxID=2739025 RepID=UPI0015633724|nr:hypothetical protein [Herbiconiux sp. VKM Ac-2851]NQX34293.1 hypothetical protein [Herbiconiux sp. VKM Ac-2851]
MSAPSTGRIVLYTLAEADADAINRRRDDHRNGPRVSGTQEIVVQGDGAQVHVGNPARADQVLPLLVVRVNPGGHVNGQVFLDGNDTLWFTSAAEGYGRGQWSWPP